MITFNIEIAQKLRKIAALLKEKDSNYFRWLAYIHAAQTIEKLPQDLRILFAAEGIKGLIHLPTIGESIAHLISEYITTGHMSRLENLQGVSDPIALFQVIPTIGKGLAQRIYEKLHVDNLASLEIAVYNGQIDQVEGIGRKRRQAIKAWLSKVFDKYNNHLKMYPNKIS